MSGAGEMVARMDDPDRGAVYSAENQLYGWLDRTPASGTLRLDGRSYRPEPDPRFTDPSFFALYLDEVRSHLIRLERDYDGREQTPVHVRPRRGATKVTYESATHTIAVPPFEVGGGWALRGLVALHEFAHHLHGEPGHGPGWRATLLRLLNDVGHPVTAELLELAFVTEGLETTRAAGPPDDDGIVSKIAKLLRQGERTANPHEREAFIERAQQLAASNSVALAVARAHGERAEGRQEPTTERLVIGREGQRGLTRYLRLLLNIAQANDVHCLIWRNSVAVTLHGFPGDIAAVKALYRSLLVQMVDEFERWHSSHVPMPEEVWNPRTQGYEWKVPATLTRRLAFYEAYAARIRIRLGEAHKAGVERAEAEAVSHGTAAGSTALALRQKELDLHDYFVEARRKNNVTRSWRGERDLASDRAPSAADEGTRAGDRARLGTEPELSGR